MSKPQKRGLGCLSIIGAITLALVSVPFACYLVVYMLARRSGRLPDWIQKRLDIYYFPTWFTGEQAERLPRIAASVGAEGHALALGGGGHQYPANVINFDVIPTPTTTVAGDAHRLPFKDNSLDAVVALAVFEHLAQPWLAAAELARTLKPGGVLYVEVPFLAPYHADPDDYYRYTLSGLRSLFGNFEEQEVGVANGPGSALGWMLVEFLATTADIDGKFDDTRTHVAPRRYMRAKELGRLLFTPLKYLDKALVRKEHSFVVAAGIYYRGIKPYNQLVPKQVTNLASCLVNLTFIGYNTQRYG